MYYKRFTPKDLDIAIAKELITTQQQAFIIKFYEEDTFILRATEEVTKLQSVIPDVDIVEYNTAQNLCFVRVNAWPHLKIMCLKFAPSKPYKWKYVAEEDEVLLFKYDLNTFSIKLYT